MVNQSMNVLGNCVVMSVIEEKIYIGSKQLSSKPPRNGTPVFKMYR